MTPTDPHTAVNHRARAQALFDAVLRTRADIAEAVRIHCAAAVSELGEPFPDVAGARDDTHDPVFDLDPAGDDVEAVLRAGLYELARLSAHEFDRACGAVQAGHDALLALG